MPRKRKKKHLCSTSVVFDLWRFMSLLLCFFFSFRSFYIDVARFKEVIYSIQDVRGLRRWSQSTHPSDILSPTPYPNWPLSLVD